MKMMVIKGNVIGGHRVNDLGLSVPYQRDVRIHFDRAAWSSDLSYALQKGLVTKVKVINPVQERRAPASNKKLKEPIPKPKKITSSPHKSSFPSPQSQTSKDTEELMKKLEQVVLGQNQVVESQKELIAKMSELVSATPQASNNSGISPEELKELLAAYVAPSSVNNTVVQKTQEEIEDDNFVFIPSTIRSSTTKVSAGMKVEEETSTRSGVDDATKALAQMRKANKKGSSND